MASRGVHACCDAERFGGISLVRRIGLTRAFLAVFAMMMVFGNIAEADAETRTLRMYYTHTKESITVTFKKNGRYVQSGLKKLNRFLRDFRRNEPTRMDPELFDVVWEIYRASGSRKPIQVISGYRSPRTNKMLRRRGRKVARNSQHTRGKALDFFLPDVPVAKLRALGLKAHAGGVGYYRNSFVHIDTGRVRHWPRMSKRQLSKVFPRGRTIHVPSNGRKMKGYKIAAANLRKGRNYDGSRRLTSAKPSLLARIFRASGDDGDENESGKRVTAKKSKPKKKVVAKKPKPAVKKPSKPKGPDPFASEVAAATKAKKAADRAKAALAAKQAQDAEEKALEEKTAEEAATQLARVIVPTRRPAAAPVAVGEAKPIVPEPAAPTQLALATPSAAPETARPAIDLTAKTGNTVRQPDSKELDALKNRIQTALARQRQLSAAEQATVALSASDTKLAVPTPKQPASNQTDAPVLQAAIEPAVQPTTTPSWRKAKEPASKPAAQARVAVPVPTPQVAKPATKPKAVAKAKPAARPAAEPSKSNQEAVDSGMIGELALGNLNGETVKEWAIASSTRIGPIAELRAPEYDQGTRRLMPGSVYSAGFANNRPPLRADRFSGRALTRVAFARVALN